MKILIMVTLFISVSWAKDSSKKKTTRKPNQTQESYFRCNFHRMNDQQNLFRLSLRSPTHEEEMVYRESNRELALVVRLSKMGNAYFRLLNERTKETISTGSTETNFSSSFTISGPDSVGVWQLDCAN